MRRPGSPVPADWLIVGLGNPGRGYDGTRHNIGREVAAELARRWGLPRSRRRFLGLVSEGWVGVGGPRVAVLLPQTYMNDAGRSAGPARGAYQTALSQVLVLHDEIDLSFGDVRTRLGGGLAGHNGLRSLASELGGPGFARVRIGVGRPDSTDPEIVSAWVLGRFTEPAQKVRALIADAADATERVALSAADAPLTE